VGLLAVAALMGTENSFGLDAFEVKRVAPPQLGLRSGPGKPQSLPALPLYCSAAHSSVASVNSRTRLRPVLAIFCGVPFALGVRGRAPSPPAPSDMAGTPSESGIFASVEPSRRSVRNCKWRSTAASDSSRGESAGSFAAGRSPILTMLNVRSFFDAQCGGPGPSHCNASRHLRPPDAMPPQGAPTAPGSVERRSMEALRGFGNRVHAGAAAYGAQVQRRARIVGQRTSASAASAEASAAIGLGNPASVKLWPPGAVDRYLKRRLPSGQRYGRVRACSVKHDVSSDAAGQRRLAIEMAHSAQVAFTLFTHIPQKDERRRQFDLCLEQSVGNGQHADHTGAIVASARSGEAIAFGELD